MRSPGSSTRDLLGAHMSIAGGLHLALTRGRDVGCSVVQIFLKNQRQWTARPYTDSEVREFRAAWKATGVRVVFAHANYLINLATPVAAEWRRAVDVFHDELERAEALGLPFVVIHPGSHRAAGLDEGIRRVARAIDVLHDRMRGERVRIVLENTAGGGATIGRSFEELAAVVGAVREPDRVGVCLDTCHLFAAGYDIRTPDGYETTIGRCRRLLGLRRVRAFHLNDAKQPLGSGLDRHEKIGRGHLGVEPFRRLMNDRRFARVPMALETPKDPEPRADREALALLRRLRRPR
ncbi:MAG TPA: deoxyribonuclease IV [Methylomirabilota bacterium]|jgi:deoxyribonuclease IV|nr:deoxyribonuclease IV [Methylomirabilota bacterium]